MERKYVTFFLGRYPVDSLDSLFRSRGKGSLTSFSEGRMVRSSMVRMKSKHGGKRKCENEPSTSLTVNHEHMTVTLCTINKDM